MYLFNTSTKFARRAVSIVVATVGMTLATSSLANRGWNEYQLSGLLESQGFGTLKFALDTTDLSAVLDENRVTLFAPTDNVFTATAEALGCSDALDLATRLLDVQVGDTNALSAILTYHASLGLVRDDRRLLQKGTLHTVQGGDITSGVNMKGLFVQGDANSAPSQITAGPIRGFRYVAYPIDSILLPIAPPADLCN